MPAVWPAGLGCCTLAPAASLLYRLARDSPLTPKHAWVYPALMPQTTDPAEIIFLFMVLAGLAWSLWKIFKEK